MSSALPSTLPDNLGSNYGLDGYQHEDDYGKGLRDHPGTVPQPPTGDVARLPQDVVGEMGVEYLDIDMATPETSFDIPFDIPEEPIHRQAHGLRDGQNVVHHEWMEATQDPARLPMIRDSVAELEELWGTSTTGEVSTGPIPREKQAALRSLVLSAMRRSASGQLIQNIEQNLRAQTRGAWERVRPAFEAITAEHGLAGNVYVRAAAYPGLHRGKHARTLQHLAKRARYLIHDPAQGHCKEAAAALGLVLVASPNDIPWEQEKVRLASKLEAVGKRIPEGTPRTALRKAFLSTSVREYAPTFFQQGKTPRAKEQAHTPVDLQKAAARKKAAQAWRKIADLCQRFMRSGLVTRDQVQEIRRQATTPKSFHEKLVEQAKRSAAAATQTFSGVVATAAPVVVREEKPVDLGALQRLRTAQEQRKRAESFLVRCIKHGIVTRKQAKELLEGNSSLSALKMRVRALQGHDRMASPKYSGGYGYQDARRAHAGGDPETAAQVSQYQTRIQEEARRKRMTLALEERKHRRLEGKLELIRKAHAVGEDWQAMAAQLSGEEREMAAEALEHLMMTFPQEPEHQGQYTGPVFRAHQAATPATTSLALPKAQRWLSQALHRGLEGELLDHELTRRFGALVQDPSLVQIRTQHEGRAGREYINANAFASASGVAGCEEGAKLLRTAKARVVVAMDRCQRCAFRTAQQTCLKYRKPLVKAGELPPAPEPAPFAPVLAESPQEMDLYTPSSAMDHLL